MDERALPRARVTRGWRFSPVWLVPLAALAFIAWLLYRTFLESGPTITVEFKEGKGIESGKTAVKYRGVKIGDVTGLDLTKDQQMVDVKIQLTGSAAGVAREGSRFWIVRPEVSVAGISGLQTIVSGDYIQVEPGHGHQTNHFVGLEQAPVVTSDASQDLKLRLLTAELRSINPGTPVFYRGVQVGQTGRAELGPEAQVVEIELFVHRPFAALVRSNSKFWNSGGINVNFGLLGAHASAHDISTLLTGGISFATPDALDGPAGDGMAFRLYDKPQPEWLTWSPAIGLPSTRTNVFESTSSK